MKKLNLIKRLWTDSHEKQSPQRFVRYAVMLIMLLTLGVGQMWAYDVYLYTGQFTDWENDNATFELRSNVNNSGTKMTRVGSTHWYHCTMSGTGSRYIVRCSSSGEKWNNGSSFSPSTSSNVIKVTGWNATSTFSMNIAGDGWNSIGSWSNNNNNGKMTIESGTVFSKSFTNVAASAHKFKIVEYGTWDRAINWNSTTVTATNCSAADDGSNDHNMSFTPYIATGTTTITYDVSTGAVTITCPKIPITLDKNGGSSDGSATVDVGASSLSTISHASRTSWNLTGYWTETSGGYKVINADGTFVDYNSNVSTYLNNATPSTWKKTSATTLYAQWTQDPTISLSLSSSTAVRGDAITLTAATTNASTPTIVYEYSTSSTFASAVTSIASTTSTSQSWTVPAGTSGTTYYLRAKMTISSTTYYSDILSLTAYGKKTIKVKDTNGWGANFKIHRWGGSADGTEWPGETTNITSAGGQWKQVVLLSSSTDFLFCNGETTSTADANKTANQTYAGMSDDGCYEIATGPGGSLALTSTANCPAKPTSISTSAATSLTNTTATINGSIGGNGNDNITDYGFYWSANAAYDTPAELISSGTKVSKGNSNYTGSISHDLTSLTAGNTIHYIAYATNGQGTTNSTPAQSFVVPYSVEIQKPTGCSSITPSAGNYYYSTGFTVTTVAATGYTFSDWSATNGTTSSAASPSSGTNTVTFTPSANSAVIKPVYTENSYSVSVSVSPSAGGSLSPTPSEGKITVKQVTGTNITANKNTNYVFDDWTISGGGITPTSSSTSPQNFKATTTGGTIQANFSSQWTIAGTMTTPSWKWDKTSNLLTGFTTTDGKTYATVTIALAANSTYTFKVKDRNQNQDNGWYGIPSGSEDEIYYSDDNTYKSVTTATGNQDIVLHTAAAGDYVFRFNITDKKLAIDYPTSYQIRFGGYKTEYLEGADGTTQGGSMSATTSGGAVVVNDGDYVPAGASVTISADETAGYHSVAWYNNADFAEGHKYTGLEDHVHVGTDASYIQFTSISEDKTVWLKYKENKLTLYVSPFLASVEVYDVGGSVVKQTIDGLEPIYVGVHTGKKLKVIPDVPYYFTGWELAETPKYNIYKTDGSGAAPAENEDYAEVNVYATSECTSDVATQTLYASCKVLNAIYFRNEKEDHTALWDSVYVGFDATWSDDTSPKGGKLGASTKGKTVLPMEKISGNTWRVYIPRAITRAEYHNVAFFDKGEMRGWKEFYGNNAVYRTDFDNSNDGKLNMYVPYHVKSSTDNTTTYYSTGYWKTAYTNSKDAGYYLVWRKSENNYDSVGTFVGTSDNKISCTLRLDNTSYKDYAIYDANGKRHVAVSGVTSTNYTDIRVNMNNTYDSKFGLTPTAEGNYVFTLDQSCDTMKLSVEFPVAVNDYVVENTFNDGSAKTTRTNVIKASEAETKTRYSMFISNAGGAATLKLRKCTSIDGSGNAVWSEGYADNLSGILSDGDFTPGVYQFDLTIDKSKDKVSEVDSLRLYTGNFYIKTDAADGGWVHYKRNIMEKNTVNFDRTSATYDNYFCKYFSSADCNIKSVIANDYCNQLSDTVKLDGIAREGTGINAGEPYVPVDGTSIRFSYNSATNETKRAYLGASLNNDFLNIYPSTDDKIYRDITVDEVTTETDMYGISEYANLWKTRFNDNGNWVYEMDVKVKPSGKAGVTAAYTDASSTKHVQTLIPDTNTVLGGSSSSDNKYSIRIVYDFKTNFMMSSFVLTEDPINENLHDFDMLWVRHKDEAATQLNLGDGKKLENVRVIGAIELRYDSVHSSGTGTGHVTMTSWTPENRPYLKYFVSFPFDVHVNNIFGLNQAQLGTDYDIQKYDGAKRAKDGLFFGDGDNYWINLTKDSVMHANEGYCVIFDNDYVSGAWGHIWDNKTHGSSVYLYFPADDVIDEIISENKSSNVPAHYCTIDRTWSQNSNKNHIQTDSHWNLMGHPLFHNAYIKANEKADTFQLRSYYYLDYYDNTWKAQAFDATHSTFKAMSSVFVQWCGDVTWSSDSGDNMFAAAPRRTNAEDNKNYLVQLDVEFNGHVSDWTYVQLSELASDEFILREDMYKMYNRGIPQVYTFAGDYDVAYNAVPVKSQTLPMGIVARKNGTYKFSMPSNFSGTVTLIDKFAQTRTNLNIEDYEVYLNKGTIDDRFELEININNAPTAIDGVTDGSGTLRDGKAHKFIMNGQMYILQNGMIYDAQGKRVK